MVIEAEGDFQVACGPRSSERLLDGTHTEVSDAHIKVALARHMHIKPPVLCSVLWMGVTHILSREL